jgi:hypothetical protein
MTMLLSIRKATLLGMGPGLLAFFACFPAVRPGLPGASPAMSRAGPSPS